MIAAVNIEQQCVWGIGETEEEALEDAKKELDGKSERLQKIGLGEIHFVRIRKNAKLEYCGEVLFKSCILKKTLPKPADNTPNQADIFQ